jgi:hypothetical protein
VDMPSSPRSAISSHAASIIASRTLFGTPVIVPDQSSRLLPSPRIMLCYIA